MAGTGATPFDVRLGGRLRSLREARGDTQRAIADLVGITAAQLQKYEKGTNCVKPGFLQVFARHFEVPVERLFDPPDTTDPKVGEAIAAELLRQAALIYAGAQQRAEEAAKPNPKGRPKFRRQQVQQQPEPPADALLAQRHMTADKPTKEEIRGHIADRIHIATGRRVPAQPGREPAVDAEDGVAGVRVPDVQRRDPGVDQPHRDDLV